MKVASLATAAALLLALPAAAQGSSRFDRHAYLYPDRYDLGGDGHSSSRALEAYYGYGTYISPFDREYRWPERLERDGGGALSYDRDYPYDFRYRGGSRPVLVAGGRRSEPTMSVDDFGTAGSVRVHRDTAYDPIGDE